MYKLLLVEDEIRMADALSELLSQEGYFVQNCYDGTSGLAAIEAQAFDVLILDVMLPGLTGLELSREARKLKIQTPILMLTARSSVDDKVSGLDSGADDYLTKPFEVKELLARLRALTRRLDSPDPSILTFGDLRLDTERLEVSCNENTVSVRLSEKECHLLKYLIANQNQVLTREQLAVRIWGYENESEYNNVEVYLSFTRKKLRYIGSSVEIKSIRGKGYELRDQHVS